MSPVTSPVPCPKPSLSPPVPGPGPYGWCQLAATYCIVSVHNGSRRIGAILSSRRRSSSATRQVPEQVLAGDHTDRLPVVQHDERVGLLQSRDRPLDRLAAA